jgi:hypothetical protein
MSQIIVEKSDIVHAWNEAEELNTSLSNLTNKEIIECKQDLIARTARIMSRLDRYVTDEDIAEIQ